MSKYRPETRPCTCTDTILCQRCRDHKVAIRKLYQTDYSDRLLEELTRPDQPSETSEG